MMKRPLVTGVEGSNEMDIRTGRTYDTYEDARRAGVPESDIALIQEDANGPNPSFAKPAKYKFTKGSFKPVKVPVHAGE